MSDLKVLKEFSSILTIPLFTSALVLQNINESPVNNDIWNWLLFIGTHFIIISVIYFILFLLYLVFGTWIEGIKKFPFTWILATIIFSFSITFLTLYILKLKGLELPINVLWILGFISLSLDLFKIETNKSV